MSRPGRQAPPQAARRTAFTGHDTEATMAAARDAGCGGQLEALLGRCLWRDRSAAESGAPDERPRARDVDRSAKRATGWRIRLLLCTSRHGAGRGR